MVAISVFQPSDSFLYKSTKHTLKLKGQTHLEREKERKMSMDMMATERVCYVHCNFCNTILAVCILFHSQFSSLSLFSFSFIFPILFLLTFHHLQFLNFSFL